MTGNQHIVHMPGHYTYRDTKQVNDIYTKDYNLYLSKVIRDIVSGRTWYGAQIHKMRLEEITFIKKKLNSEFRTIVSNMEHRYKAMSHVRLPT